MPTPDYRLNQRTVRALGRVRQLRRDQTNAERALWQRLRSSQLAGYKFRRQHELGGFVLDFYCAAAHLALELDGGQHFSDEGLKSDAERTRVLAAHGVHVLRFTNTEVLTNLDAVVAAIEQRLSA